jgi:hypothetical protein
VKTTHQIVLTDEYIAEGQRLSISQNKTLKFMYQTWWMWWLPRVAMVGIMWSVRLETRTLNGRAFYRR